jgi:hypothetical protein
LTAPKLQPAILGGIFMGILSALPYVEWGNCCCLWVIGGGALGAYLMQQDSPAPVTLGDGALVGMFTGLIGAPVMFLARPLILTAMAPLMTGWDTWIPGILGGDQIPPELGDTVRRLGRGIVLVLLGLLVTTVFMVVSTVGGILGAAMFRKPLPTPAPELPPSDGPPV